MSSQRMSVWRKMVKKEHYAEERINSWIPQELSFEQLIGDRTTEPCSLVEFMDYLVFVEQNAEYLQFFLWFCDYVQRWARLGPRQRALSSPWYHAGGDVTGAMMTSSPDESPISKGSRKQRSKCHDDRRITYERFDKILRILEAEFDEEMAEERDTMQRGRRLSVNGSRRTTRVNSLDSVPDLGRSSVVVERRNYSSSPARTFTPRSKRRRSNDFEDTLPEIPVSPLFSDWKARRRFTGLLQGARSSYRPITEMSFGSRVSKQDSFFGKSGSSATQPFHDEAARIVRHYIGPLTASTPRPLFLLTPEARAAVHLASLHTTHPTAFLPALEVAETVVRMSHPSFILWTTRNANIYRLYFWRIVGAMMFLMGVMLIVLITVLVPVYPTFTRPHSSKNRRMEGFGVDLVESISNPSLWLLRLIAAMVFLWPGALMLIASSLYGLCIARFLQGIRDVHPWEYGQERKFSKTTVDVDPVETAGTGIASSPGSRVVYRRQYLPSMFPDIREEPDVMSPTPSYQRDSSFGGPCDHVVEPLEMSKTHEHRQLQQLTSNSLQPGTAPDRLSTLSFNSFRVPSFNLSLNLSHASTSSNIIFNGARSQASRPLTQNPVTPTQGKSQFQPFLPASSTPIYPPPPLSVAHSNASLGRQSMYLASPTGTAPTVVSTASSQLLSPTVMPMRTPTPSSFPLPPFSIGFSTSLLHGSVAGTVPTAPRGGTRYANNQGHNSIVFPTFGSPTNASFTTVPSTTSSLDSNAVPSKAQLPTVQQSPAKLHPPYQLQSRTQHGDGHNNSRQPPTALLGSTSSSTTLVSPLSGLLPAALQTLGPANSRSTPETRAWDRRPLWAKLFPNVDGEVDYSRPGTGGTVSETAIKSEKDSSDSGVPANAPPVGTVRSVVMKVPAGSFSRKLQWRAFHISCWASLGVTIAVLLLSLVLPLRGVTNAPSQ